MVQLRHFLLFFGLASAVVAAPPIASDKTRQPDIVPGAYIVEFADGHDDETSFYSKLDKEGLLASKRMSLNYSLFKGSSFHVHGAADTNAQAVEDLAVRIAGAVPEVKKIWPVHLIALPADASTSFDSANESISVSSRRWGGARAEKDSYSPHVMTQVDKLRADGYTGKGIRIGIVDTGVDYKHPALGGCFGEGCLISYGTDLVGDDYNGTNTPVPDPDPYSSCQGHGTHVAGIIAAQENPMNFTGAAPDVSLGMYKVFGCVDNTATDVLIAAFNQAYEDGSDIITSSVGGNSGWPEDPWSVAVSRIVNAGVPCTLAAGNSGAGGLFYAGAAADGKGVTAVASVENTETPLVLLEGESVINNSTVKPFGWTYGSPAFANVTLPLWVVTPNVTTDDSYNACSPLADDTPDLSGRIVLVEDNVCGPWPISTYLAAKGAEYIMFYYFDDSFVYHPISSTYTTLKGTGMVTRQQGVEWRDILTAGGEVVLSITEPASSNRIALSWPNTASGGLLNTISSWGPTWEVDVKPQVAAPGGSILSTYPLASGGYAVASGTSMATPLTAAIFALVMQARGIKDPKTLQGLLMSTAAHKVFYNATDVLTGLAPVPQQGGGLVQAYDAAHATALISPNSVSFNDTDHFRGRAKFKVHNTGFKAVTYKLGHSPSYTMYTFTTDSSYPAFFPNPIAEGAYATLSFFPRFITVPPWGSVDFTVVPTPPSGLNATRLPVYSGFITLSGSNGDSLSVPYLGAVGSLHSTETLYLDDVYLTHYTDFNLAVAPANDSFAVPYPEVPVPADYDTATDYPAAVVQLNLGSALVRVDVVPVGVTQVNTTTVLGVHVAGSVGGFPVEWTPRRYFISPFTGMTQEGSVLPEGSYAFLVRALKVYGDRKRASDYETVKMVPFTLSYTTASAR